MKTYLQLCKDVCREAGLAAGEASVTSVINQVGQVGRIVGYVRQSWVEIQTRYQHTGMNWRWMRSEFELTTVGGTDSYAYGHAGMKDSITNAAISRFRNWMIKDFGNPPKCYLQSAGKGTEGWLIYMDWDDFKHLYRIGTQNQGQPAHITISPQNQIVLGPTPDGVYVISGDYMKGAQILAADADLPDLPEDFQDVIVYMALSKYGVKHNIVEAVTAGEDGAAIYLGALESDQLSEIPIGNPLA